jgi:superfamily II DNA or RNA helicase
VLRDYQTQIIDDFNRLVAGDMRSVLLIARTGSGKMVIASALVPTPVAAGLCRQRRPR